MTAYTGVTLDKFSKREIIGMASSLQNKVEAYKNANTDVLEEIRKFNENFVTLKTKINLVKKVNTLLNKRVSRCGKAMLDKCPIFKKGVFGSCRHSS